MAAVIVSTAAFAAGLALTLLASELLARGLTRLGAKAGISEGLIGLLSALGADSPELSSAVVAILAGARDVGVGVVLGSNLFNLAALLGLASLVAGGVRIRREPLLLDALAGLLVLLLAGLLISGWLAPLAATVAMLVVFAAYSVMLATPRPAHDAPPVTGGSWLPVFLLPFALAGVSGGSFVVVHSALSLALALHLSAAVVGTLVLAVLTSLPNLWVALHFARSDRGTALFSAAMNSNTINLAGGLALPALVLGLGSAGRSHGDFFWLILLTVLAVVMPLRRGRLGRVAGALLVGLYLVFVLLKLLGV